MGTKHTHTHTHIHTNIHWKIAKYREISGEAVGNTFNPKVISIKSLTVEFKGRLGGEKKN